MSKRLVFLIKAIVITMEFMKLSQLRRKENIFVLGYQGSFRIVFISKHRAKTP